MIFFGGLLLGWGPIHFATAAVGLFLLLRELKHARELVPTVILLLALIALGSYFVVSYIFSNDAFYFTFTNYSTIIRFSDTALPAYFLLAPVAFRAFTKRGRRYVLLTVALFLVFLVFAVPFYESYASSTLTSYTRTNPFSLNYRTDAVIIRDYISSHKADAPFYIIGWPTGWDFTPGTDTLTSVHVYTPFRSAVIPYLSYDQFVASRWTTFYVYTTSDLNPIRGNVPYLLQFINPGEPNSNTTSAYTVTGRDVLIQELGFTFIKVQVSWR